MLCTLNFTPRKLCCGWAYSRCGSVIYRCTGGPNRILTCTNKQKWHQNFSFFDLVRASSLNLVMNCWNVYLYSTSRDVNVKRCYVWTHFPVILQTRDNPVGWAWTLVDHCPPFLLAFMVQSTTCLSWMVNVFIYSCIHTHTVCGKLTRNNLSHTHQAKMQLWELLNIQIQFVAQRHFDMQNAWARVWTQNLYVVCQCTFNAVFISSSTCAFFFFDQIPIISLW